MYCSHCGKKYQQEQKACPYCGEKDVNPFKITTDKKEDLVKKDSKKLLPKILTIVIIVVLCIAAGIFIKNCAYKQSDEYKLEVATQAILNGNYSEAVEAIKDINDYTSKAMKEYITVLEARDELIKNYPTNNLATDDIYFDNFSDSLENFTKTNICNYLPDKLFKQYTYYKEYLDTALKETEGFYEEITDFQQILLCEPRRRAGKGYDSIADIDNITVSTFATSTSLAYQPLKFNYDDHCKLLLESIHDLENTVDKATEIEEKLKTKLENEGRDFGEKVYPEYYKKNPENFSYDINAYLKPVSDESDIKANAELLARNYKCALMISYFKETDNLIF